MIASVSGELRLKQPGQVVIEAAGVGYQLSVSDHTLGELPAVGERATLLAVLAVREDAMQLYGFAAAAERELFNLLTSVSGVGPKVALAVLSGMSVAEAETALVSGDHARFQKISGIGKRTAERLVVELKDKVVPGGTPTVQRGPTVSGEPAQLAREALVGLGYSQAESEEMLAAAEGETPEELIASALRGGVVAL